MKSRLRILSLTVFAFTSASMAQRSELGQADHFTKKELKSLVATASTPEDYRKLAVYYERMVQHETAEAQKAEQELKTEQANPASHSTKNPNGRLNYFQYQLEHHRGAAEKAQALTALHRERAGTAPIAVPFVAQSRTTENCCSGSCCSRSGSC